MIASDIDTKSGNTAAFVFIGKRVKYVIVYLAGKMKGLPDLGRKHFRETEIALTDSGHIVLNPGALPTGMPEERYMPVCLAMLMQADAVLMLEGWQKSSGAIIENMLATYQGKRIYFEGEPNEELWGGPYMEKEGEKAE